MKPIIAIVGRPNVGKSTLFNRLIGKRTAIVDPKPGVTRDRREGDAYLGALNFKVIDTAGLDESPSSDLEEKMQIQTKQAVDGAHVVLLLFDARAGITPLDTYFADMARKFSVPVILVANKCESRKSEIGLLESYSLGLGAAIVIASEHGLGMPDLEDAITITLKKNYDFFDFDKFKGLPIAVKSISKTDETDETDELLKLAIVGRPNVGKSTLINTLVGEQRLITGPEPGITRDAISLEWDWNGNHIKLIDTAGMRRKSRVLEKIEKLAVNNTLEAIRFANVVVVVFDATAFTERQDLVIARHVIDEG